MTHIGLMMEFNCVLTVDMWGCLCTIHLHSEYNNYFKVEHVKINTWIVYYDIHVLQKQPIMLRLIHI